MGDTVSTILELTAVEKGIISWRLGSKILRLMIKSLEKETVKLGDRLIRLSDFLCYGQRKLIALNLKWKFKFGTGN